MADTDHAHGHIKVDSQLRGVRVTDNSSPEPRDSLTVSAPVLSEGAFSIQEAIDAAEPGETVFVPAGMYLENITIDKPITLLGAGPDQTIIDGGHDGTVITIRDADATVSGFAITGGLGPAGGVYLRNTSSTITGNRIAGNCSYVFGAGILVRGNSSPVIADNVFENNRAADRACFAAAYGGYGGGIYFGSGTSGTVSGNEFLDNWAWHSGGAIYVSSASPVISENIFIANQADWDGGVKVVGGNSDPTISNNIFDSNFGDYGGGGTIAVRSGSASITNNTIVHSRGGYGILIASEEVSEVWNNVLASNAGGGIWAPITTDAGHNLTYDHLRGDYQGGIDPGPGAVYVDPQFVDAANRDYRLSPGSPAIDAAADAACPPTDLLGHSRPADGNQDGQATCDIGAYELGGAVVADATAPTIVDVQVSGSGWGAGLLSFLGAPGFAIPAGDGDQLLALPWRGVDEIHVVFSEEVVVAQHDLLLVGVNVPFYTVTGLTTGPGPDVGTFLASWTLQSPIELDKLRIDLTDTIQDLAGNALDGEWDNPTDLADLVSDTYPSGDTLAGGDFQFRFNVVEGDASGAGSVGTEDYILWANNFGLPLDGDVIKADFNAGGTVGPADYTTWANNFADILPVAEPLAPAIQIAEIPEYAVDGFISGTVSGVDPEAYRVALYIQIEGVGWWTKPTFDQPTVPINPDGTFSADAATGGIDNRATIFAVALVPVEATVPLASAAPRLPETLDDIAVAIDIIERFGSTIEFAGRTWGVKEAPLGVGPGNNVFSDEPTDVFVDEEGLHLTVNFHDGEWRAIDIWLRYAPRQPQADSVFAPAWSLDSRLAISCAVVAGVYVALLPAASFFPVALTGSDLAAWQWFAPEWNSDDESGGGVPMSRAELARAMNHRPDSWMQLALLGTVVRRNEHAFFTLVLALGLSLTLPSLLVGSVVFSLLVTRLPYYQLKVALAAAIERHRFAQDQLHGGRVS